MANLASLRSSSATGGPTARTSSPSRSRSGLTLAQPSANLEHGRHGSSGAHRRQRDHGRGVRRGRLRHLRHQPRRRLPGRGHLQHPGRRRKVGPENNGALTIPANISGNPAMSVPVGHRRRPAGRHAGHRPSPRGRAPVSTSAASSSDRASLAARRPERSLLIGRPGLRSRCQPSAPAARPPRGRPPAACGRGRPRRGSARGARRAPAGTPRWRAAPARPSPARPPLRAASRMARRSSGHGIDGSARRARSPSSFTRSIASTSPSRSQRSRSDGASSRPARKSSSASRPAGVTSWS